MPDNQEKLLPYALTTPSRIKELLEINDQDFDKLFIRLINSVSDFIQQECNGRRFLRKTYVDEVYSSSNQRQRFITLRQCPVYSISALSYRAGPPSAPAWQPFTIDQFELINPQPDIAGITYYPSGMVRVYGFVPTIYNNMVRATYTAGYLIDFANAGDLTKHTLPSDLTRTAENIVVRWFKRKDFAGKDTQTLETSSITFSKMLDSEDQMIIAHYRLIPGVM